MRKKLPPIASSIPGRRRWGRSATTSERDYSDDEREFMLAVERYKRERQRPFPEWSEVLAILRSLGYRKVAEPVPV